MTECRSCQRVNPDAAEICPGCGIRLRMSAGVKILIGLAVLFVGLPVTCVAGAAALTGLGYLARRDEQSDPRPIPAPVPVTQWDEIPSHAGALLLSQATRNPEPPPAEQIIAAGYGWSRNDRVDATLRCTDQSEHEACTFRKRVQSPVGIGSSSTPGCLYAPEKTGQGVMIAWGPCVLTFALTDHPEASLLAAASAIEDWRQGVGRLTPAALEENRAALRAARRPWRR